MEYWDIYKVQVIESIALLLLYFILSRLFNKAIAKTAVKFNYHQQRTTVFKKVFKGLLLVILIVLLTIIWGVDQSRLFFYISSFLTVLAVGFVAQWSILSNITATIIIFFYHTVKIGDIVSIHEKDSLVEGEISDIGLFFITIVTPNREEITIPSNLFIQKAIKKQ